MRKILGAVALVVVVTVGCGGDDTGESAVDEVTSTQQQTSAEPEGDAATTTTVADATTTTVAEDDDVALAVAYCGAYEGERNVDEILGLMTEDAVAIDMTLGAEYSGQDEIRAWIEDDPAFSALDVMTCSDEAVVARDWFGGGYALGSSTEPGGTEGVGVGHIRDGKVDRFLVYYTPVAGEPTVPGIAADADMAVVDEYCRAYADRDEDAFVAVVSEDFVRYAGPTGLTAPAIPGLEGFQTWAAQTADQNVSVDCGDLGVGNGPWIASANIWTDAEGEEVTGGVDVVAVVESKATRHYVHYTD